jgi:soluble lytic murein transglycosylase-like protein
MLGSSCNPRSTRVRRLGLVCLLLACAAPWAAAQVCGAAPVIGAAASAPGEKFSLIATQCQVLDVPMTVHRAAQLDLYNRPTPVAVVGPADAASAPPVFLPAPIPASKPRPSVATPPSRDAARVLSLAPALTEAAREHQIDPLLLHAIAHVESRHNAQAKSKAGARGVMQVMPATAKRFGVADPERSLFDAPTNLRASAAYLRTLRVRYGDDLRLVLAAYNAGEGAVDKHGGNVPPYAETQAYVRDVMAVYRRLSSSFAVSASGQLVSRGSL